MPSNFAVIEGDKVVNIVLSETPLFENWIASDVAQIGWSYMDGEFSPPPAPPVPVPASITFAQLLIGLVSEQWITEFEGEQWLQGVLPPQVTAFIETLPAEQQFAAKARASRPSVVLRDDSLVVAMGAAQNKTPEEIDDFFRTYAGV